MGRITFISRMTVKPGREKDFVDACNELTAKPRRYAVLESFPSEEAEHSHMNSPWLAAIGPRIVDCLDGTWEREYLDAFRA
jgi:quinol monooxygenase YgiN